MTAVTITQVKEYLRYEAADNSQDTALGIILDGGRRWVENYTGHILVQRPVAQSPRLLADYVDLRWRPYVEATLSLTVLDADYAEDDTFADFVVFEVNGIWRVKPKTAWPTTTGGFTFAYMAGYDDSYGAPEVLWEAVALHAGMTDEQRGDQSSQGWKSLYNLLEQYRMPVLA